MTNYTRILFFMWKLVLVASSLTVLSAFSIRLHSVLILVLLILGIFVFFQSTPTHHTQRYLLAAARFGVASCLVFILSGFDSMLLTGSIQSMYYWIRPYFVHMQFFLFFLHGLVLLRFCNARCTAKIDRYIIISLGYYVVVWIYFSIFQPKYSGSLPYQFHNSFFACCAICLYASGLYRLVTSSMLVTHRIFLGIVCLLLFLIPFFGFLRAASILIILATLIILLPSLQRKGVFRLLVVMFIFYITYYSIWPNIEERFSDNMYAYSTPLDVFSGAVDFSDPNAQGRIDWWQDIAFPVLRSSPLWGSAFSFNFNFGGSAAEGQGTELFHNYWISNMVDGGLLLFIPSLLCYVFPVMLGLWQIFHGNKTHLVHTVWLIAFLGTITTNTWAHASLYGVIISMISGYAASTIVVNRTSISIITDRLSQSSNYAQSSRVSSSCKPPVI